MQLAYLLPLLPCIFALPAPHGSAAIASRQSSGSCSAGNFKCDASTNSIFVCIAGTMVTTATVPARVCSLLSSLGSRFGSGSFASSTSSAMKHREDEIED